MGSRVRVTAATIRRSGPAPQGPTTTPGNRLPHVGRRPEDSGHAGPRSARPRTPTACCRPIRACARWRGGSTTRSGTCRSSRRTVTSTPGCWSTTCRSATRPRLLVTPDHYVTRLLHAARRPARRPRRGPHRPRRRRVAPGLADAVLELAPVPRHAVALLAGDDARRRLRRDRAALGADRGRHLRPGRAAAREGRLPPACPVRPVRHRGAGHHRRPVRRPGRARRARRGRRLSAAGCCRRSGRTATWSRPRRAGPTAVAPARRGERRGHRQLRRLGGGDGEPPGALPGARRRLGRPQPRGRRHRAARRRRGGADLPRGAGRDRRRPRTPSRCAGTCCWRWPGCPATTGW